jgi:hypothetical protein
VIPVELKFPRWVELAICRLRWGSVVVVAILLLLFSSGAPAQTSSHASALLVKRAAFESQLKARAFGEPLHLVSHEKDGRLEGDVYAELDQSFARVSAVLGSADSVCEMLFLHLNIRSCKATRANNVPQLALSVGPKQAGSAASTYSMVYAMQVDAAETDYLGVKLSAPSGPLSTRDYAIVIEATPLGSERTFLHFGYAYTYGRLAKMAMGLYLATAGRTKIGFTVVGTSGDGQPQYVQGERGSLERNVMRNYLALKAYSGVQTGTPQAQMEARFRAWFALTERHAAQLHELDLDQYLDEKHADLLRMGVPAH